MGRCSYRTGKLIKELPEFSEVFPGWDVPIEENNAKIEISEPVLPAVPADKIGRAHV